ncbi:MAG: DUF4062 domain-containing protein, partial [Betaproteobacteria bacterium]
MQPRASKKRIYVSSTFLDLQDYRAKVNERLRRAGFDLVAMEDYPAFDERPVDKCLADVETCEFYVGILAKRYGYVPEADNPERQSITEREYRHAGECGIPRLVFQLDPKAPWVEDFDDRVVLGAKSAKSIQRFRGEVGTRHGIRLFRTPDELAGLVLEAIQNALNDEAGKAGTFTVARWIWPQAWDFTAYMEAKREHFVGRDWLFDRIAGWMNSGQPRALLIRADFGVGKSAIMAELVRRNPGGIVAAWHFCQHDTHETLHPATFVRSLAARLKDAIPGYRAKVESDPQLQARLDKAAEDPSSTFEAAILNSLSQLPPPAKPLLILIDALDESLDLDQESVRQGGSIVSLLTTKASRMPSWLRVLATSRSRPEVITPLRQSFGMEEIDAEQQSNQDDLRKYVTARCQRDPIAAKLRDAEQTPEKLSQFLLQQSHGKFLYAVRALNDLANGAMTLAQLASLPPGMDGFYLDAFRRRFPDIHRYEPVRELLGLMAAAQQPLTPAELSMVLGISEDAVDERAHAVGDFVKFRSGAYAADHFSLMEWLTLKDENRRWRAAEYHVDKTAAEAKLRIWALGEVEAGQAHKQPYLLRNLASHLHEQQRAEAFAKLMFDFRWIAAKVSVVGIDAVIADCAYLGGRDAGQMLLAGLRNSANVIRRAPHLLAGQLLGRFLNRGVEALDLLCEEIQSAAQKLAPALLPRTGSLALRSHLITTWECPSAVSAMALLPDGRIAAGFFDGSVRVWDPQGVRDPLVLHGHEGRVNALIALPDGCIASGSVDSSVRVWDPQGVREPLLLQGHEDTVTVLVALPDGCIASGSADGTVRVWDLQGVHEPLVLQGHEDMVTALIALRDERVASGSVDGSVRVWDPQGVREPLVL